VIQALRNRNFAFLWVGQLVSALGDYALFMALPFYVLEVTGSTSASGALLLAGAVPRVALGAVAGVLADRWDRRRVMIAADFARAALLLSLLLARLPDQLWVFYAVFALQGAVGQFFWPAKHALIPSIVPPERLQGANALNAVSDAITRLAAPGLGGLLLATVGYRALITFDAATYLVSAALLAPIAAPAVRRATTAAATAAGHLGAFRRELAEGLRLAARNRTVVKVLALSSVAMSVEGMLGVLFVAFVRDALRGGALQLGWLGTAGGAGGLISGLVLGARGRRFAPERVLPLSLGVQGSALLVMFTWPSLPLAVAATALVGACVAGLAVAAHTLIQATTPNSHQGRIFGAYEAAQFLAVLAGQGLAVLLGDRIGSVPLMSSAACVSLGAAVVAVSGSGPRAKRTHARVDGGRGQG
jgi:MFS family permease